MTSGDFLQFCRVNVLLEGIIVNLRPHTWTGTLSRIVGVLVGLRFLYPPVLVGVTYLYLAVSSNMAHMARWEIPEQILWTGGRGSGRSNSHHRYRGRHTTGAGELHATLFAPLKLHQRASWENIGGPSKSQENIRVFGILELPFFPRKWRVEGYIPKPHVT